MYLLQVKAATCNFPQAHLSTHHTQAWTADWVDITKDQGQFFTETASIRSLTLTLGETPL
jgi:hypothetical protein